MIYDIRSDDHDCVVPWFLPLYRYRKVKGFAFLSLLSKFLPLLQLQVHTIVEIQIIEGRNEKIHCYGYEDSQCTRMNYVQHDHQRASGNSFEYDLHCLIICRHASYHLERASE